MKKGSILIFVTWILLLLTLLAVSVGLRSRLGIGLATFQNQYLSEIYSTHSAVNLAAFFINQDEDPQNDWVQDVWYDQTSGFSQFGVSKEFSIHIIDEESKLNLNALTPQNAVILEKFFSILKENHIKLETDPKELASGIMNWMGKPTADSKPTIGFEQKKAPFESIDELLLIQKITAQDFEILKPFFTVYSQNRAGQLKININTAHPWVLRAIVESLTGGDFEKQDLFNRIERYRKGDPKDPKAAPPLPFMQSDLRVEALIQKLGLSNSVDMVNMMNQFVTLFVTTDSQFFSVHVETKKKGYVYPRAVDAVLGFRQPVLVQVSKGVLNLQQRLNNALNGYPYEILYWNEQA